MASAIIGGLIGNQLFKPEALVCTSAADGTGEATAQKFGIQYQPDLSLLLREADPIVLAFKPQQLNDIPEELASLTRGRLIISILAGTTIARLQEKFPQARNIVRSMPNTPGQIGSGITAFASAQPLDVNDTEMVFGILGALGEVLTVQECELDAVTGLSGSGPAYVFEFVAALRDGGIQAGLTPETAYKLAVQTVIGAGQLLKAIPESPEQHRDWVSSPGGTTLAGLAVMKERQFRTLIGDTVLAAKNRSIELAKG